ncbi:MAG: tRNA (N6-threonylcarbamoyladenosine(37)-N6)-methyltransferase TrmO, partial [Oscillospiraceae bacterium]|nr:tRNA (N6-threonylcarbamoyladenosine(37)-N6)-methyltransferase TrmO [Oscillospiraceae bacterium]
CFPPELLALLPEEKQQAAIACLADDPRPSYQHDPERQYSMEFAGYDIHFFVSGQRLSVTGVDILSTERSI